MFSSFRRPYYIVRCIRCNHWNWDRRHTAIVIKLTFSVPGVPVVEVSFVDICHQCSLPNKIIIIIIIIIYYLNLFTLVCTDFWFFVYAYSSEYDNPRKEISVRERSIARWSRGRRGGGGGGGGENNTTNKKKNMISEYYFEKLIVDQNWPLL